MTRSAALFIDSPNCLDEVARQMAEVTDASVAPGAQPQVFDVCLGEVTAPLAPHVNEADQLPFLNRYRYALVVTMTEGCTAADSPEVKALRDLARRLRESTSMGALLVLDVQNRAAPAAAGEPVLLDWSAVGS